MDVFAEPDGSEVFVKYAEDRATPESLGCRETSFYEEFSQLKKMYQEFPGYFPEPFYAVRAETDSVIDSDPVMALAMEDIGETYPVETAEAFGSEEFYELTELIGELHSNRLTAPHGDLGGNIWMTGEDELVVADPKGKPISAAEARRWREQDLLVLTDIAEKQGLGNFTLDEIKDMI